MNFFVVNSLHLLLFQISHVSACRPSCKMYLQASDALNSGEVPVGCLMVYEDKVVGRGRNEVNETKNVRKMKKIILIGLFCA